MKRQKLNGSQKGESFFLYPSHVFPITIELTIEYMPLYAFGAAACRKYAGSYSLSIAVIQLGIRARLVCCARLYSFMY